jgi:hypothetical protein
LTKDIRCVILNLYQTEKDDVQMKTNTEQTQTIVMADFHNRFVNLRMKGTWGYNPSGISMLTAESYIEELEVTDTRVLDENGERLEVFILVGVDKYGRELEIPMDKVLAVGFLGTKEQARLKGLTSIVAGFDSFPQEVKDSPAFEMFKEMKDDYDKLIASGVELYQRGE